MRSRAIGGRDERSRATATRVLTPSSPSHRTAPQTHDLTRPIRRLQPTDLNALNVLHITGTKGKGSTAAFTSSLLRSLAPQAKVGLYTSPHMIAVRERIRIGGVPLEEGVFARYFWEVWEKLERADKVCARPLPLQS